MKPAPFTLVPAESAEHAVALLAEHEDEAKILAGGQSLLPMMGLRLAVPTVLVDVSRVDELRGEQQSDGSVTLIGAVTTHSDIEDGRVSDPTGSWLRHVAAGIGYRAIRNRGTVAGSLAHADGSAEWPVVMSALDAEVLVRSTEGERAVPCASLFQGFFTTALEEQELITGVRIPTPAPGSQFGFDKSTRKVGEFAESMCFLVDGPDRTSVWLGGHRGVPLRLSGVERLLRDGLDTWSPTDRGRVVDAVVAAIAPDDHDPHAEQEYRQHLHGETVWRALRGSAPTPTSDPYEQVGSK